MKRLILLLFVAVAVRGEIGVHYYPYDDCSAITGAFEFGPPETEVRRAGARIVPHFVEGAYSGLLDLTSGYTLHLFPDHRAMLTSWCDICPTKLAAEGTWLPDSDTIRIRWKVWHLDASERKFFVEFHGACESLGLYLAFDKNKVHQGVLLVSKDKEGPKIELPLVQRDRYVDWKKIEDELSRKKG